jgi:glycosyltransferase involved in cell wall biosynthesis
VKVCLVGHSAAGFSAGSVGGSERQSALLARELAARGHEVTYVVTGLAGGDRVACGVHVRAGWDPARGRRFVRAVSYRYPRLYRLLREERADVYYARGAGFYTPFVVRAALDQHAVSVLALASDRDLYPSTSSILFGLSGSPLSPLAARLGHSVYRRWALPNATWIAVQNREQAAACMTLRLRNVTIPNIVLSPPDALLDTAPERDVIWAGNVREGRRSKGLEELTQLAARLPDVTFTVAGTLDSRSEGTTIESLRRLANVDVVGPLSHEETQMQIARHRLVINTSPSEGFSNVMLEGWSLGRPSVTLSVNPSGLLTDGYLGMCADGDLEEMTAAVGSLVQDDQARGAMAARCREYVASTHSPGVVCRWFEQAVATAP